MFIFFCLVLLVLSSLMYEKKTTNNPLIYGRLFLIFDGLDFNNHNKLDNLTTNLTNLILLGIFKINITEAGYYWSH